MIRIGNMKIKRKDQSPVKISLEATKILNRAMG